MHAVEGDAHRVGLADMRGVVGVHACEQAADRHAHAVREKIAAPSAAAETLHSSFSRRIHVHSKGSPRPVFGRAACGSAGGLQRR